MITLLVGIAAIFVALFLAGRAVLQPKRVSRLAPAQPVRRTAALDDVKQRAAAFADRAIDDKRKARIERRLESADITMRAGEFVTVASAAALGGLVLGAVVGGPLLGLVLAGFVGVAGMAALRHRADRRNELFTEQLPDTLQLLSGNLRVGYGLMQSIETAAVETDAPTSVELHRVMSEVRLGRDLAESLHSVAERTESADFEWIVQAIAINREVGGDLAEVLDSVADTVRARAHLARQVRTLSAEGRISAYVLLALPIVVGTMSMVMNPESARLLFNTNLGIAMLAMCGVLMTAGSLWLRRLVRPVY